MNQIITINTSSITWNTYWIQITILSMMHCNRFFYNFLFNLFHSNFLMIYNVTMHCVLKIPSMNVSHCIEIKINFLSLLSTTQQWVYVILSIHFLQVVFLYNIISINHVILALSKCDDSNFASFWFWIYIIDY